MERASGNRRRPGLCEKPRRMLRHEVAMICDLEKTASAHGSDKVDALCNGGGAKRCAIAAVRLLRTGRADFVPMGGVSDGIEHEDQREGHECDSQPAGRLQHVPECRHELSVRIKCPHYGWWRAV